MPDVDLVLESGIGLGVGKSASAFT